MNLLFERGLSRNRISHNLRQAFAGADFFLLSGFCNAPGNLFCPAFFPEIFKELLQVLLRQIVDELLGCQRLSNIHAHIQWFFIFEAKAPAAGFKLMLRQSQVQQNAVNRGDVELSQVFGQIGKTAMPKVNLQVKML